MITVEFFGIPRKRAGVPELVIDSVDVSPTELVDILRQQLPEFAESCLSEGGTLQPHYLWMLQRPGEQPIPLSAEAMIPATSRVLVMSADVGG